MAGDVAVLVATHAQTTLVQKALLDRGVPAVIAGSGSVFATPAADEWLVLLEALEQPHRSDRVRAAALTPFLGRTAAELATAGEELTDEYGAQLRQWADLLTRRGVAALLETASERRARRADAAPAARRAAAHRPAPRRPGAARGRRRGRSRAGRAGRVAARAPGRGGQGHRRRADPPAGERRRRGAGAHPAREQRPAVPRRVPAVRLRPLGRRTRHAAAARRRRRAGARRRRGRVDRTPGAGTTGRRRSGGRVVAAVLRGRDPRAEPGGAVVGAHQEHLDLGAAPADLRPHPRIVRRPRHRTRRCPTSRPTSGSPRWPRPVARPSSPPSSSTAAGAGAGRPAAGAGVGRFDRPLDTGWRRTSYSALSAAADHVPGASDAGPPDVTSEPETGERGGRGPARDRAAGRPAGRRPAVADGRPAQGHRLRHAGARGARTHRPDGRRPGRRTAGALRGGGQPPARAGRGAGAGRRAAAGAADPARGSSPTGGRWPTSRRPTGSPSSTSNCRWPAATTSTPTWCWPRWRRCCGGTCRPTTRCSATPTGSRSPELGGQPLRGYLTGSLDVVLRLPGPRYLVADYKTNWLGRGARTPR